MRDDPGLKSPPEEELVPEDDAIIARVFRRSVVVIVLVGVVVFAAYRMLRTEPAPEQVIAKDPGAIPDLLQASAGMPQVIWTDVTQRSGIDFVHSNGARGEKLLPETMGSGAVFFDHDGDADADLLLLNARAWPGEEGDGPPPTPELYDNDGTGAFRRVTAAAGLDDSLYGTGAAAADYDNDGDVDLFLTALGPNRMLRNDGGRFTDVTAAAGVAGDAEIWSAGAGFFDYDNDGDLDLFVCNYVAWSREIDIELNFTLNGRDRAYGPPTSYAGRHSYLYRNDDGRFTDVSAEAGIQVVNPLTGDAMGKALALSFADVDGDGWIDIFVANDTVQNFLFHNRGDGTFAEIGATAGIGFDGAGNATGAMGVDSAYYRNDRQFAVAIANFSNEMSSLYVAQRDGLQFTDESAGEGIGAPSRIVLSFGLLFLDYDLDGRLDMLQANGHLEEEINQVQASQHYRQPAQLFWNAGPDQRSCFAEVPADSVGDLARPIVGRGAASADIDGDGDLDILLTQAGRRPLLLRNEQALGHHWLRVKLTGTTVNRDAIGAWIELEAGGERQRRQVMPTRSYLSQPELPVTFGLGSSTRIDALRVIWPDGTTQQLDPPAIDTQLDIVQ